MSQTNFLTDPAVQAAVHAAAQAAEREKQELAFGECAGMVADGLKAAKEHAERHGQPVRAFGRVVRDDGSKGWVVFLTQMLCTEPSLAGQGNGALAAELTSRMTLSAAFDPKRFSKPIPSHLLAQVRTILPGHGYDGSRVETCTDIKRVIKGGNETKSRVQFTATGITIGRRAYQYRQRERTPTGLPHNDFSIRIAGMDTPMVVVLTLLGIGIREFIEKDAAAVARATSEALTKRSQMVRPGKVAKSVRKLQETMQQVVDAQRDLAHALMHRHPLLTHQEACSAAHYASKIVH
ncbi:hypothetical protein [Ralstonia pseudosolanacearum]|uniref:hypothetical protein n=1 Tax=Ralstonia pseudosolanacearum TaxID=1310165 RepID=UPI00267665B5|nr:hypothetical protein [Ralstonia pseudosolanacearum]MDO3562716.1 hypothetical protein [Ralstonia pseudosolanacearum]MDO3572377.1 hypothetical protein [Ralstonia pseudosolanacearum]